MHELLYLVSSGEQHQWPLQGAILSVPTDACTWGDMVALDLVVWS